ncbi:hypothetical protein [Clostridium tarantellae]|uniref:Bypass of forespore C C-terminal domain-containing protein n=1 Tax=Clostridium tarantellae TaxID=39493 RepID=A0A6I1MHL0_9CLOT|nr:hypothetical protein [Clostridium tarantellae]MPQ43026.1 hypothetical protein [Clostridium tarantellae]
MNWNKIKNNKVITIMIVTVLSLVVFSASYFTSFIYNSYNTEDTSSVMNETKNKEETSLKDDVNIVFTRKTPDKNVFVDYKTTIGDYKKQIHLDEVTVEGLEEILKEKGYEKVAWNGQEIIFSRNQEISTSLEPNKYYIGEKDGCIAMFKSDENGIAIIEKTEDITFINIETLPDRDREAIKNFNKKFDTREQCEEELSAYTS